MKKAKITILLILFSMLNFSCAEEDSTLIEETDYRINLEKTWSCEESSELFGEQLYEVIIIKGVSTIDTVSDNENKILRLFNFLDLGNDKHIFATYENYTIKIVNQKIDDYTVNGIGSVSRDFSNILFEYSVDDGNGAEMITATYNQSQIAKKRPGFINKF